MTAEGKQDDRDLELEPETVADLEMPPEAGDEIRGGANCRTGTKGCDTQSGERLCP